MFHVTIDDRQVQKFIKKSPARANWALRTSFWHAGKHYRDRLDAFISSGGPGNWPPLSRMRKKGKSSKPLANMGRLVRFRVSRIQKTFFRLRFGFFHAKAKKMKSAAYKRYKSRFKADMGMTPATLAAIHESGRRRRIPTGKQKGGKRYAMQRRFAAMGAPLKSSTKVIETPARPMMDPFYRKFRLRIPNYIESRFFKLFFSRENPQLRA